MLGKGLLISDFVILFKFSCVLIEFIIRQRTYVKLLNKCYNKVTPNTKTMCLYYILEFRIAFITRLSRRICHVC